MISRISASACAPVLGLERSQALFHQIELFLESLFLEPDERIGQELLVRPRRKRQERDLRRQLAQLRVLDASGEGGAFYINIVFHGRVKGFVIIHEAGSLKVSDVEARRVSFARIARPRDRA